MPFIYIYYIDNYIYNLQQCLQLPIWIFLYISELSGPKVSWVIITQIQMFQEGGCIGYERWGQGRAACLCYLTTRQSAEHTQRNYFDGLSDFLITGLKNSKNDSINTWLNVFNKMITFSLTSRLLQWMYLHKTFECCECFSCLVTLDKMFTEISCPIYIKYEAR